MDLILDVLLRGLVTVAAVIALTRLNGLRSFSKLSSFDFSLTVAFGSIVGGALLSPDSSWTLGLIAVGTVFLIQFTVAFARSRLEVVESALDNPPILLMQDGEIFDAALKRGRVTHDDLFAKLRESNVMRMEEVRAVVMESTGDVSVLHGEDCDLDTMLRGVVRVA